MKNKYENNIEGFKNTYTKLNFYFNLLSTLISTKAIADHK